MIYCDRTLSVCTGRNLSVCVDRSTEAVGWHATPDASNYMCGTVGGPELRPLWKQRAAQEHARPPPSGPRDPPRSGRPGGGSWQCHSEEEERPLCFLFLIILVCFLAFSFVAEIIRPSPHWVHFQKNVHFLLVPLAAVHLEGSSEAVLREFLFLHQFIFTKLAI